MTERLKENTRLEWIDVVKFFGIFAIVWGHTLSDGAVHRYLYSFHVPLFFFVIGLFFTSPKQDFLPFIRKKARGLLVPYFVFATVSILVFAVLGNVAAAALGTDISAHSLGNNLLEMLTGRCRANQALWFLPCLFVFYVVLFWVTKAVQQKSTGVKRAVWVLVLVLSAALCFFNASVWKIRSFFWNIEIAVFMLFFFAAAVLLRGLFQEGLKTKTALLLAVLFLVLGGVAARFNPAIIYVVNYYGNVFLFYFGATCTAVGLCFLSMALVRTRFAVLRRLLVFTGQKTLPILLLHKFPVLFFQVVFPVTKPLLKENNAPVGFLVAALSIAACLFADFLYQKIKSRLPLASGKK